jgi:hypothetical protein
MSDLRWLATTVPLVLIALFFVSRIVSLHNKSALIKENGKWNYYKNGKRIIFEYSDISSVKKSVLGLYSSFVLTVENTKIRIPAELRSLGNLFSDLSGHLPQEQLAALIKFHEREQCIFFEMEKASKFLRFFCFLIVPIAFFTANHIWGVWGPLSELAGAFWVFFSLIFPFLWIIAYWVLLKITVSNFAVFSKIPAFWAVLGGLLYMVFGTAYREFYTWVVFNNLGF